MRTRGRPRTSDTSRTEQLRLAKRAQRERQRRAGIRSIQLELPDAMTQKLKVARADPGFLQAFDALLEAFVVRIADHPQLRDLAWNRKGELIAARETFQLYERNWRFIDVDRLGAGEHALIDRLARTFGNGIINA